MRHIIIRGFSLFFLLSMFTPLSHGSITIPDPKNDPYLIGKHAYHNKLACDTCPLADTVIDADKARELLPRLNSDPQLAERLTPKEREAVTTYLKTLFRLN